MASRVTRQEIRKALEVLQKVYDQWPEDEAEGRAGSKFSIKDAIAEALQRNGKPMRDWELVQEVGSRVTWGKGAGEVFKSLTENVPLERELIAVDEAGKRVEFRSERTWFMARRAKKPSER